MSKADKLAVNRKRRLLTRTIILGILVLAVVFAIATKDKVEVLAVGDEAPDFELIDLDGNVHRLSDYRGEGVFLNFWGTWCPPCKEEMPYMENVHQEMGGDGVHILAVNIKESTLKVQNFSDEYGLTFPIALDKTETVKERYNFKPLPTTFIINKDGIIEEIISRGITEDEIRDLMQSVRTE